MWSSSRFTPYTFIYAHPSSQTHHCWCAPQVLQSFVAPSATPGGLLEDQGLAERLAAAASSHQLPVLIVHGRQDALVPLSNSQRLLKLMPQVRSPTDGALDALL